MPGRYGHDPGADQRRLDIAPQRAILACGGRQPVPLQCRGYRCVRQRPQGRRRAPADPGAQRELCGICLARTGRHFWELATQYARLSDGRRVMWSMARPFRLDTTPWSGSVDLLDQQLDLNFYERGARTWQLPSRERNYAVQWQRLIYGSGDTVFRLGLAARRARYSYSAPQLVKVGRLPASTADERTLAGIGPGFNLHQDRYASFSNVQSVGRVEDHNLCWDVSGSLLYDSAALGATDAGPALAINATRGWQPTPDVLILAQGSFGGRRRGGQWRNADLRMAATAYGQVSSWQTLVAHADYASLTHPDPENRLYVGGFQALRGYPNFYASGSRRLRPDARLEPLVCHCRRRTSRRQSAWGLQSRAVLHACLASASGAGRIKRTAGGGRQRDRFLGKLLDAQGGRQAPARPFAYAGHHVAGIVAVA